MMSLQSRIDSAPANGLGFLVEAQEGLVSVNRDARIYGDGSPWWGPARIDELEIGFCRVLLERLTVRDLWIRAGYLSQLRDVLVIDGMLTVRGSPSDPIEQSPSAVNFSGVHVRGGGINMRTANHAWFGGSVERTTQGIRIGVPSDRQGMSFYGTRWEHDERVQIVVDSGAPVVFIANHFTLTDVLFTRNAHPDSAVVGSSFHDSRVIDQRPRSRSWWPF
jgi:hypothetical protein